MSYIIEELVSFVEEDNYEEGVVGDCTIKTVDVSFQAETIKGLIEQVSTFVGTNDYQLADDESNRIDWQVMEDEYGQLAYSDDIELWKSGGKRLYLVNYTGMVYKKTVVDLSQETI